MVFEEKHNLILDEEEFFNKPVLFFFKNFLEKKFFNNAFKSKFLDDFELSYDSKIFTTKNNYCIKTVKKNDKFFLYYYSNCKNKIITLNTNKGIFSRKFKFVHDKSRLVKVERLLSKPKFIEDKSNNNVLVWVYNSENI